jgi:hypothetical protein
MRFAFLAALVGLAVSAATLAQTQQAPPTNPVSPGPTCTSAQHRAFDFWVGRWDVYPTGKAKMVAHSRIENLYGGCVIRENWMPFNGNDGGSLNTYDPQDRRWHQVWMDSSNGRVAFDGGVEDGKMVLRGNWKGAAQPGQDALVRMTYSKVDAGAVRQFGEISTDKGATWKPFFDFTYKPSAATN